MHLILRRTPRGLCRVCKHVWYDTDADSAIAAHNRVCGQAHYERTKPDRDKLAFLDSADPELQEYVTKEYRAGRLKPSTKRVI